MITKSITARWLATNRVAAIDDLFAAGRINRRQANAMKQRYASPQRAALALSRTADDGFENLLSLFAKPARRGGNPVLADMERRQKAASAQRPSEAAKQRR